MKVNNSEELMEIIENSIVGEYKSVRSGNNILITHDKFRMIIFDWRRAVGFDNIIHACREHKRRFHSNKKLILCSNRMSEPAREMGYSKAYDFLRVYDLEDLKNGVTL